MTYPEFREQEEEVKIAAREKLRQISDDEFIFKYFWFGVESRAVGRDFNACPFNSGKNRFAFLAGMEWFDSYCKGDDFISPEYIAGLTNVER